jgi:hypothetical protein
VIDSEFDDFLDHVPLPIPFGHRNCQCQSSLMVSRRKPSRGNMYENSPAFNQSDRPEPFVAQAIEEQYIFADLRSQNTRRMVRFGLVELEISECDSLNIEPGQSHTDDSREV